jgi:hypothetical protein
VRALTQADIAQPASAALHIERASGPLELNPAIRWRTNKSPGRNAVSTTRDRPNVPSEFTRLTAGILFAMVVGMGYVVSPRVESAVDLPIRVEEQGAAEAPLVPGGCIADGLALADCNPGV